MRKCSISICSTISLYFVKGCEIEVSFCFEFCTENGNYAFDLIPIYFLWIASLLELIFYLRFWRTSATLPTLKVNKVKRTQMEKKRNETVFELPTILRNADER